MMHFGDTDKARRRRNTRHIGLEILIFAAPRYLTTPMFTSQAKVDVSAANVDKPVLSRASDETFFPHFFLRMGHLRTECRRSRQFVGRSWHRCLRR